MSIIENTKKAYIRMSAPVKASLWFTICSILQKGITLLSTPIFTRLLTTEQYGVYSVYQAWYFIINIFATLNLYLGVYNNGMTKFPEDRNRFTSSMLGLSTTITMIFFVVYLFGQKFWTGLFDLSPFYLYAMFIAFLFTSAYNFWSTSQRFDYKYKKLVIITIVMAIATPVSGIIGVLITEHKAEARVFTYVLVQSLIGLILYVFIMKKGKCYYSKEYWKYGLAFNIPLIPHYLSTMVLNQSDRIMINNMVGSGEAAIYSVAYQVSMMMTIITTAINNSYVPYTFKELRAKRTEGVRRSSNFLLILVGCACLLATAFGPEIIRVFASKEYYDAIWVIPPVSISVYFMFLYPLFANVEFYFEKTKFVAIASTLAAILNLGLNYVFIPIYGYYATGYTTLASYIVYSCAHMYYYKKIMKREFGKKDLYDLKFIFVFSIFLLISMLLMTIVYKYIVLRYSIILIILIILFINRGGFVTQLSLIRGKQK
ncbi:lipopolysaccharide biosynthesis protein [Enterococcus avium]|uniref:lipopolysaccharide biosynthesis protein n=1 Tax=Enterococcus avium TaxID=33945 RepID=UPI00288FC29A|nr:flippase [Enterococcus avium]MDT2459465.1 flippase [Enterococcus avium]